MRDERGCWCRDIRHRRRGPTAIIRFAACLDHREASNGTLLSIKRSPQSVAGESDLENLMALIRTDFQLGGQHVQFSVLFITMDRVSREDIIERTEHRV